MNKQEQAIKNDDFPPFSDDELAQFKPIEDVLDPALYQTLITNQQKQAELGKVRMPKVRGKQKAPTKERVSIRLSVEILQAFRATGRGWQTRLNDVLLDYIQHHDVQAVK